MTGTFLRFAGLLAPLVMLGLSTAQALADTCPEDCSEPPPATHGPVNVYSQTTAGHLSLTTAGALVRIYVPNRSSNSVSIIDPATLKEVDRFPVGRKPQHVVPSWDLKTLWVANNASGTDSGSLTPIDPKTGRPAHEIAVDDPYNMYFMPDGSSAIIVDEAYIDFGGESVAPLIAEYPNLLVVQTLSKSRSLAGLRVGMALGHPDLIEGLNRIKNSFNSYTLDRLALAGAVAAIEDRDYFEETSRKVVATRDRTTAALRELGFEVIDSLANFVFVTHPQKEARELFALLKERGILVRYFNKPRIDRYLRVSIGTDEEMDALLDMLRDISV